MKMIVLSGLLAISLSSFGAIRAVTPTAWNGDPNCWQMKRHLEKMSVVTNGGAKVVFIGDSITHFWETHGKAQLAKHFGREDLKMLNLGTSGDRTEHVLWRLTKGGELDGYEAKVVFLMIGTNNSGHFKFSEEPPIDTILGIREILKVIRSKQPKAKVVLTAIFPCGADVTDARRRRNEVVNKEIAKFADGQNVFWLDFNDQFLTVDGRLPREVFPDLLHPGPLGYEIWASAALPYANAALAGLPMPPNRWAPFIRPENVRMSGPAAAEPVSRWEDDWRLDRALEKRNQIAGAKGQIDLVFFGDSITHNWEMAGKPVLDELGKTYSVLNIGCSGEMTENLLWRGANGELDGYEAKVVMLTVGTNNSYFRKDRPQDIAAGIRKILDLIVSKQPKAKILLLPIFPYGDSPKDGIRVNDDAANELIRAFADGRRIVWIDFNDRFLDAAGNNVKWMPDHSHPNEAAYREIWLPAVLPYFKEACGK